MIIRPFIEWNAPTVIFAILVATFKSRSSVHAPLYSTNQPITMPTLLVYGLSDNVIPAGWLQLNEMNVLLK